MSAAIAVISEQGLHKTTVKQISDRANVAVGLINHHFNSKDDLVTACYRRLARMLSEATTRALASTQQDPEHQIKAIISASFDPDIFNSKIMRTWLALWSIVPYSEMLAKKHVFLYDSYREILKEHAWRWSSANNRELDTDAFAKMVTALIDGLWLELPLQPHIFSRGQAEEIALSASLAWLTANSKSLRVRLRMG